MIPKPPPREASLGFLYFHPYRVQGVSIAGEQTCVMVPELDLCFDMGLCPRASLSSKHLAISHGHMDHIGGLAYWCSQRHFQGMGAGNIICHPKVQKPIKDMLEGFNALEEQKTPFNIIPLDYEQELEIKNNTFLRAIPLEHTVTTSGYTVIEHRSKLKDEYAGLPQEKLREIKDRGEEITRTLHIPLIAYLSDTAPGPALLREDVLNAKIVIAECTFVDEDHVERAKVGKHLHIDHIAEWLPVLQADALVLVHLSRRSNIAQARKRLKKVAKGADPSRVHFLMDYAANRKRYEHQAAEAERIEAQRQRQATPPNTN